MFLEKIRSWFGGTEKRQTGKVIFFNKKKGYGFIKPEALNKDIFVHISELKDFVRKGDQVSFVVGKEGKGLKAMDVERMS